MTRKTKHKTPADRKTAYMERARKERGLVRAAVMVPEHARERLYAFAAELRNESPGDPTDAR